MASDAIHPNLMYSPRIVLLLGQPEVTLYSTIWFNVHAMSGPTLLFLDLYHTAEMWYNWKMAHDPHKIKTNSAWQHHKSVGAVHVRTVFCNTVIQVTQKMTLRRVSGSTTVIPLAKRRHGMKPNAILLATKRVVWCKGVIVQLHETGHEAYWLFRCATCKTGTNSKAHCPPSLLAWNATPVLSVFNTQELYSYAVTIHLYTISDCTVFSRSRGNTTRSNCITTSAPHCGSCNSPCVSA